MHNGEDFTNHALEEAERTIGYQFRDKTLFKTCLTHKSWSNLQGGEDNERLEFLGDAVLEFIVTEALYKSTHLDEGVLTGLRQQYVSQTALEEACERIGLKKFMRFSGGEQNVGGKTASNLFEAVLGGIYLDGGLGEARKFLNRFLKITESENYKTYLQEYVQERDKSTPVYTVEEADGGFRCQVAALGQKACGKGASKKAAETQAAKALWEKLTERGQN